MQLGGTAATLLPVWMSCWASPWRIQRVKSSSTEMEHSWLEGLSASEVGKALGAQFVNEAELSEQVRKILAWAYPRR